MDLPNPVPCPAWTKGLLRGTRFAGPIWVSQTEMEQAGQEAGKSSQNVRGQVGVLRES